MRIFAITALALTLGNMSQAQEKDITGNWQGTLQAGNALRTVLKITKDDGKLKANMYSVDQGGQPTVTSVGVEGTTVNFAVKALDLTYTGTLNPPGGAIAGSATQNGQTHVLNAPTRCS